VSRPATRHAEKMARLARRAGVLRPRDLDRHRIPRMALARMQTRGELERIGHGLYSLPGTAGSTVHQSLIEVAKRTPRAVACLLTALRFHDLTTQAPFEIWIALPRGAWRPRFDYPPLRVMRFSGNALTEGVEKHLINGVEVRVYSVAKTAADCFKYRNKIGLDVALEALREAWRERRTTSEELHRFARICRVENVIRPYLEALIA